MKKAIITLTAAALLPLALAAPAQAAPPPGYYSTMPHLTGTTYVRCYPRGTTPPVGSHIRHCFKRTTSIHSR